MKNSKDKSIIKLIIIFVLYYVINNHLPNLITNASNIINRFVKDMIIILVFGILYYKDLKKDWGKFKRSDRKYRVLIWSAVIFFAIIAVNLLLQKFWPSVAKSYYINKNTKINLPYYNASPIYSLFKAVIYSAIAESILFNLSFRKVFNNDVIFILISSLVYAYFYYMFGSLSVSVLIGAFILRFIPECIYNFVYVKNDNNIAFFIIVSLILNTVAAIITLTGIKI